MPRITRKLLFEKDARDKLKAGVDTLANVVGMTLGPKGRNVIFEREYNFPVVVNDGVTIAKEVLLEDDFENIGAQLLREAAIRTNDVAGDGTTTSIVIAQELLHQAFILIDNGENPMDIKRMLEKELRVLLKQLAEHKITVDSDEVIANVATVSANNDREIGDLVMKAVKEVGKDGVITVEEHFGIETKLEIQKGFQIKSGLAHPILFTDFKRKEAEFKDILVICMEHKITGINDFLPIATMLKDNGVKECVLVASEVGGDSLAFFIEARRRSEFHCVAVKAPYVGERQNEYMADIAAFTGGKVIGTTEKAKDVTMDDFGTVRRVISSQHHTTFIEGEGDEKVIKERVFSIMASLDKATDEFEKQFIKERASKLRGGVAVLKVGALSEPEMKEKKYRIEDAINATQAALKEGVVIGGGMTFRRLIGADTPALIANPLFSVFKKICENAGVEPTEKAEATARKGGRYGYNVVNDKVEDLFEAGILDPYTVVRSALENSFSIAMMILSTGSVIAYSTDPAKARII